MHINTPKKRKIFTFVMRCISFLSFFSFHSLIVRFPLPGCFYSKHTSVCRLPFFYLVGQWRPIAPEQPVFVFRWIRFPVNLPPTSSSSDFSFSPSASLHPTPSIHLSLLPNHPLPEAFPASFIDILQVCPAPSVAIPIHCLSSAVRPSQQDPPSSSVIERQHHLRGLLLSRFPANDLRPQIWAPSCTFA